MKSFIKKIIPQYLKEFISFKPWMSDEKYLKQKYKKILGKELNLENPQTFNEKLQWLKLYDRNPEYTKMVDKYEAKKYVASIIGEEYIIPTFGVWDKFEDIDFDSLPNQFVLKTTHDSGGIIICKDKKTFDYKTAKKKLNTSLKRNYYLMWREWPYKNVAHKIIAEKYMEDSSTKELHDYKVFCCNGEAKMIQVDFNRFINHQRNIYTTDWKYVDLSILYPNNESVQIKRPEKLDEMLLCARKLSEKIPFLRTDFYVINEKLYFGELTFYHGAGIEKFTPESWNLKFGEWIDLSVVRGK